MSLSIVFIHRGNSWYLPYTFWQCRETNPDANIYLIGDNATKHLDGAVIKHISINDFANAGDELKSIYKHKSNLGVEFEIACIERWFILSAFLKKYKINNCVYLDSDILPYQNLEPYSTTFNKGGMTWCGFSAHSNFISNTQALDNYCGLVLDIYRDKVPPILREKGLYEAIVTGREDYDISDMTFFHDYNLVYPNALIPINNPDPSGTFDIAVDNTKVFKAGGGIFKKIDWKGNQPYCTVKETNEIIPMVTLHFQGFGKGILKDNFKYSSLSFLLFYYFNSLSILAGRIKNKL